MTVTILLAAIAVIALVVALDRWLEGRRERRARSVDPIYWRVR